MIIYNKTISDFINDCESNNIQEEIVNSLRTNQIVINNESEQRSWQNSLPEMAHILNDNSINKEIDCAIEYKFNASRNRIDFIVYGKKDENKCLIIFELKQWSRVQESTRDWCVLVNTHHAFIEDKLHPSFQAWRYKHWLEDMNNYCQENHVLIKSASYLHNMDNGYQDFFKNTTKFPFVEESPIFFKGERWVIRQFISNYVNQKDHGLLYNIDASLTCPSTELRNLLINALKGKDFWTYDDEQAISVSTILDCVRKSSRDNIRRTIIIKGAPGTGKSIVAINALGKILSEKFNAIYCTQNSAPRDYFSETLIENSWKKTRIKELFCTPINFVKNSEKEYHCILADEAHRLIEWKGWIGVPKNINILDRLFNASLVNVFFVDEDQAVTIHDYGKIDNIKLFAAKYKSEIIYNDNLHLTSQFRCWGGEQYINFIKCFLGYNNSPIKWISNQKYDFKIFDDPNEMRRQISLKNEQYGKSRLVAGYTHDWVSKNDIQKWDFNLENNFKAKWNFKNVKSWIYDEGSKDSIGCIHTCQGIDMQYCGVIIGKDMRYENNKIIFDRNFNAKTDRSSGISFSSTSEALAHSLIRNTYNVLLTRGMRGTYIYCEDKKLNEYLKSLITLE